MNQPGKGIVMREKANQQQLIFRSIGQFRLREEEKCKKLIYFNCKKLIQSIILIDYALNDEKKYQLAIEQCEKVLIEEPSHLHAQYRKSFSFKLNRKLKYYEHQQEIQCIDKAS
ncbi:unnamed protein product [Paramecium pentaurelia]|uniref:Uncharacterized protein n=1 Tax=Paramecium pentaurelia TaxID=43138 RepID=A0A8S1V8T0_9CILI|nr:unnamed protein product [Paramecium pentaurelia]